MNIPDAKEIASWFDDEDTALAGLDGATVHYACYATGNYEGDWCVVFEKDGAWRIASGGHCSCSGPEWSTTVASEEEARRTIAAHAGEFAHE